MSYFDGGCNVFLTLFESDYFVHECDKHDKSHLVNTLVFNPLTAIHDFGF